MKTVPCWKVCKVPRMLEESTMQRYPWRHCNPWWQVSVGNCTSCCCSVWLFPPRTEYRQTEDLGCASCQLCVVHTRWACMRDITHTVALVHRDIHTLGHATKHTEPHKCTQAYINTNTRLHALFVASVSHSATCTFSCNSETAAHLLCQ